MTAKPKPKPAPRPLPPPTPDAGQSPASPNAIHTPGKPFA